MLLIPSPGGKLIKQDPVSERIAYAPLFGLWAPSLCFYLCLRAGSLLYKIRCPNGYPMLDTQQQDLHWQIFGWRPVSGMLHVSYNIVHVA